MSESKTHDVVIIGGGTAGITVAARLRKARPSLDIAMIDPSEKHYYQPLWTLVGGGVYPSEVTERSESKLIPKGVTWIKDHVTKMEPDANREQVEGFDMIHVVPPQSAPYFVRTSALANAEGWVEVDRRTLQHVRFSNVFSLGDTAGTPNAKTGAAVRKQAPVVVANLLVTMDSKTSVSASDGYSSCLLDTGYGKLVLAEFDYDNNPMPSFPFDTTKERRSMCLKKLHLLPKRYWHGMMKGRA